MPARIATYAILGALAGGAPGEPCSRPPAGCRCNASLYVAANLFLLALALAIATRRNLYVGLQSAGQALLGAALPMVRPLVRADSLAARAVMGMVWGLVPCALIYGVLPIALFAGSAAEGAAVMVAFGLGTRRPFSRPAGSRRTPAASSMRPSRGSRRRRSSGALPWPGLWRAAASRRAGGGRVLPLIRRAGWTGTKAELASMCPIRGGYLTELLLNM